MNFNILLPSKRGECLETVIDIINNTAWDISLIEIHLGVDEDNGIVQNAAQKSDKKWGNIFIYITKQITIQTSEPGNLIVPNLVGYYNWLALNFTTSKYIIPMNDDALFISENLDIKAYEKLEEYLEDKEDGIVFGITDDMLEHPHGYEGYEIPASLFPIISKAGINYFKYLFHPRFYGPTADPHIAYEYYKLNRMIDLKDIVKISHRPEELKKINPHL